MPSIPEHEAPMLTEKRGVPITRSPVRTAGCWPSNRRRKAATSKVDRCKGHQGSWTQWLVAKTEKPITTPAISGVQLRLSDRTQKRGGRTAKHHVRNAANPITAQAINHASHEVSEVSRPFSFATVPQRSGTIMARCRPSHREEISLWVDS